MTELAELPPRVGVGLPADYAQLDLSDPRYSWARRVGVQAAAVSRRGGAPPAEPVSFVQLTVAVVADWSAGREPGPALGLSDVDGSGSVAAPSTPEPSGSTVDRQDGVGWVVPAGAPGGRAGPEPVEAVPVGAVPVGAVPVGAVPAGVVPVARSAGDDWLRPPAYLLVNGLPAAQLVLERRLRPPGAPAEVRTFAVEVLVPLPGSGHVVVVTAATTNASRQDEAEWTALAVAGTLTYRPAARPAVPAAPPEQPLPELRFADPARLLVQPDPSDPPTPGPPTQVSLTPAAGSPAAGSAAAASRAGPPRGMIGQAAVDQLAGLVARHPAAPGAAGSAGPAGSR
jgi:hypothetical protein